MKKDSGKQIPHWKLQCSALSRVALNSLMMEALSYRNQSFDMQIKSMDWFLYDRNLRHERAK